MTPVPAPTLYPGSTYPGDAPIAAPPIWSLLSVEEALRDHLKTWASDFLAWAEDEQAHEDIAAAQLLGREPDAPRITIGSIPRPQAWRRFRKWELDSVAKPLEVNIVSGDPVGAEWVGGRKFTAQSVIIAVATAGGDTVDADNAASVAGRAFQQLIADKPFIGLPDVRLLDSAPTDYAAYTPATKKSIAVAAIAVVVRFPEIRRSLDVAEGWQPTEPGQTPVRPPAAPAAESIDLSIITTTEQPG